jgi:Fe-S oxidoreductase
MVPHGNMHKWIVPTGLSNNSFMMENELNVPTVAELLAKGETPDILFWVGCAGSFDERAQKITRDICRILQHVGLKYAILGTEESCTGDPAKRSGNEFLFQMQAMMNIEVLNGYEIKKIVTACPHCFNTLKNEYPSLGGNYEVIHHTQLIQNLIDEGKLKPADNNVFKGKKITYHDPCYLGRANEVYEAPRKVLESLDAQLIELKRCKSNGLCCGAGGGQMFKEPEPGVKDINIERIEEVIDAQPQVVAAACPFCMTMLKDGVKIKEKETEIEVLDIAEITARANRL